MAPGRVFSSVTLESPLGPIVVVAAEDVLCAATFSEVQTLEATRGLLSERLGGVVVDDEHLLARER